MFKHILVSTDGSEPSLKGCQHGLELARQLGSGVTVVTVTTPWRSIAVGEVAVYLPEDRYEAQTEQLAKERLARVEALAKAAGVSCQTVHRSHVHPWEVILSVANEKGCDLIVMGSHGASGVAGLLVGSQAHKVLTHTALPVLVVRG